MGFFSKKGRVFRVKKINYLLHDVTVINFVLIGRLAKRYRWISMLSLAIISVLVPYLYFSQPVYYQKTVHFKIAAPNVTNSSGGASTSINELMEGASSFLKKPEILAIVTTYDFTTKLSEAVLDSKFFGELNFDDPSTNSSRNNEDLRNCQSRDCKLKVLRNILPTMYVVDTELATGRFSLKISTRSSRTTLEILRHFQSTLESVRLDDSVSQTNKQIKQLQDLISKSRADIAAKGGFERIASSEFMDAMIAQLKDKVRDLSGRLIKEGDSLSFKSARLKETNNAADTFSKSTERQSYENYNKIFRRVEELRMNIASINSITQENRSATDELVLNELRSELASHEAELKKFGNISNNLTVDSSFITAQKDLKSNFEFEYKITNEQLKKLKSEFNKAKEELDEALNRKAEMENNLVALKPDLEYLKLLESKLVAMKIKLSSISSDVDFDQFDTDVSPFKRNTLVQILLFSFLVVCFLSFVTHIFFYLWDDRIFEELELEKCMDDLNVIGQVPYFK